MVGSSQHTFKSMLFEILCKIWYNFYILLQQEGSNKLIIVKVATTNSVKIEAIKKAFNFYFEDLAIIHQNTESGVPEQPINEQVYQGAENRLERLKNGDDEYDYLVSCEGGLVNNFGRWFNVQVVAVEDSRGKKSIGLSSAYPIPDKFVHRIIDSSLANVLDEIFKGEGGIRKLTHGQITRFELVEEGIRMALTGIMNEGW